MVYSDEFFSVSLKQGPLALRKTHLSRVSLFSRKHPYVYYRPRHHSLPQNTVNEIAIRPFVTIAFN